MTAAYFMPTWQPSTTYAAGAYIIPTTFAVGSYTWTATVGGASGSSEPSWPPASTGTDTVTDGSVTWLRRTAARQQFQAGILAIIAPFITANPNLIRASGTTRPLNLANVEHPYFFIGDMDETQAYANGVRTRTFAGLTAYVVDMLTEPRESNDRLNFLADVLTEVFTAGFHAAGGYSILQLAGINDFEFEGGTNVRFPALQLTFAPETAVAEGRT